MHFLKKQISLFQIQIQRYGPIDNISELVLMMAGAGYNEKYANTQDPNSMGQRNNFYSICVFRVQMNS